MTDYEKRVVFALERIADSMNDRVLLENRRYGFEQGQQDSRAVVMERIVKLMESLEQKLLPPDEPLADLHWRMAE